MNDFDNYFNDLDKVNYVEKEKSCCEIKDNFEYTNKGETICKVCNNIINNIIDTPEWKNYKDSNQNMTRCGMPTNIMLPQSSLCTNIKYDGNIKMNRVNKYQKWNSMPYKERSLYKVYKDIEDKCELGKFPKVISETAQSYYLIISETKISRGSNRIGIVVACIYSACRECGVPRSTNELSCLFGISNKIITKGCKNFTEIMRMSKHRNRTQVQESVSLHDFTYRFCHKLNINQLDIDNIKKLSKLCEELNLTNDNTPPSMAAGCIFLYLKSKKIPFEKKDISDICKISEVTINKCSKKIECIKEIQEFLK